MNVVDSARRPVILGQELSRGGEGVIYAITQDGDLLWFLDANRDGTGNVGSGKTIGHGGWNAFASTFAGGGGVIYAITKTAS